MKNNKDVTNEPRTSLPNYPFSHVNIELTNDAIDECFCLTVHGVKHYLHSNTVQNLCIMLISGLLKWEKEAENLYYGKIPNWHYTQELLKEIAEEKNDLLPKLEKLRLLFNSMKGEK
jgi:hypothetical protein